MRFKQISPDFSICVFLNQFIIILFIYFWLCWVFAALHGHVGFLYLKCLKATLWVGLPLFWSLGSRCTGYSSCPAACGIFPEQGSNHVPYTGKQILTTEPPKKSSICVFKKILPRLERWWLTLLKYEPWLSWNILIIRILKNFDIGKLLNKEESKKAVQKIELNVNIFSQQNLYAQMSSLINSLK